VTLPAPPPFVATELCRERIGRHTCDGRRNLTDIQAEYSFVDFSEISSEFDVMWHHHKEDQPSETASVGAAQRALRFLAWLSARPETRIAVVSHWVFFTHLFALFDDPSLHDKFGNAEMRKVVLCDGRIAPFQHA